LATRTELIHQKEKWPPLHTNVPSVSEDIVFLIHLPTTFLLDLEFKCPQTIVFYLGYKRLKSMNIAGVLKSDSLEIYLCGEKNPDYGNNSDQK
jgi:hypothetical protein